jgi:hypothetical protein
MNLQKFNELLRGTDQTKFGQQASEWKNFFEFISSYFEVREIKHPIIVEIGVWYGNQKKFYRELLDAEHISIDIASTWSKPDILGDSCKQSTLNELKNKLRGRQIDLLFIDGWHTYEAVKSDYEMYSPLVKHISVIHDIKTVSIPKIDVAQPIGVMKFWNELSKNNEEYTFITFHHHNKGDSGIFTFNNDGRQMGIGMVIKNE